MEIPYNIRAIVVNVAIIICMRIASGYNLWLNRFDFLQMAWCKDDIPCEKPDHGGTDCRGKIWINIIDSYFGTDGC